MLQVLRSAVVQGFRRRSGAAAVPTGDSFYLYLRGDDGRLGDWARQDGDAQSLVVCSRYRQHHNFKAVVAQSKFTIQLVKCTFVHIRNEEKLHVIQITNQP